MNEYTKHRFCVIPLLKLTLNMTLRAIAACSLKQIVHRDIKLDNILIGKDFVPKLSDFGMSWFSSQDHPNNIVGTNNYKAPELFNAAVKMTFK